MPPRKKSNASSSTSKKSNSNQHTQPSKFGIQHFFERHSQSQILKTATVPIHQNSKPSSISETSPRSNTASESEIDRKSVANSTTGAASGAQDPKKAPSSVLSISDNHKNSSRLKEIKFNEETENTPPEDLLTKSIDVEVSPDVPKSISLKRFKFSPGMLIKQSQDDGGDEITWKISPVNEKLQSVSKHMPEMIREWISSPRPKSTERSLLSANKFGLKRVNPFQDTDFHGTANDVNSGLCSQQSPFLTPPSLSFSHSKLANGVTCNGISDQLELRHHKKALLELLDQVEDAISVEDTRSNGTDSSLKVQSKNSDKLLGKHNPPAERVSVDSPEEVARPSSDSYFLVLEVYEKRGSADGSGAQQTYKILRLLNEQSGEERSVYLWEDWYYSIIAPGDTVNVIGEFDEKGKCDVDRENNLIIVHPDILVSGTRVAASFSCSRRTVLDERLRSSEHSTAALIGTMLHQIFQAGLMKEFPTIKFLKDYARIVLLKNIESLYACGGNENDMLKTLIEAIPKMLNWIVVFRDSQDSKASTVDFGSEDGQSKVGISEVIDIEEMAWAPKYGLKGMIDASLRVKFQSKKNEVKEKIMPLEFKTGKVPNGQAKHRAQVILYTLLMSERYLKHIDNGLLYYLQSDGTQGIKVRRSDLVGLIMSRNELANDILKASTTQELPPMLQIPNMCKSCRHLDVCSIYHKAHGGTVESSGLGEIFHSRVSHLTTSHIVFLRHWDRLIDLEAKQMQLGKKQTLLAQKLKTDQAASCLRSIVLDPSDELQLQKSHNDDRFIYRFVHQHSPSRNVDASVGDSTNSALSPTIELDCTLSTGDYVVLSTESGRLNVARGIITDISRKHVSVSFSKRLRLPGSNPSSEAYDLLQEVWQMSKDEFMTSFSVMRYNLIQLFLPTVRSSHLRKMIVDLEAPRFDSGCLFSQDPAISYIWSEKNLNDDQRRAILKILTAKDYALILGMPGTGKTSTMVHAVKALLLRGSSILLTSYTNSAVDNLLIKLKAQASYNGIDFVRIGRHEAVHEEIQANCFSATNLHSVEEIKLRLDQVKVVAVTCLGITNPLLANKRFDVCIMDEAGQTTLPVCLGPLMFASIFVLVGDHYQLPPLVQSAEARENGMGISLFCRLSEAHPQAISALRSQYRMCQGIMDLSNALIYGERLRCGSSEIANAKLKLSSLRPRCSWLNEVLNPSKPVIFINTDKMCAFETREQKTVNNPTEAYIIAKVAEELVNSGIEGEDVGIITPYNSQTSLIRLIVNVTSVEIHTIDKYQGRDKDCILVSFVRSSENPRNCSSSLLGDWHRINVALTRAKKKLILVGSCATLSKFPLLKLLINKVDEQSGILSLSKTDIDEKGVLKRCSRLRLSHI
ncbi:DNA replication ATP-dependent helicase/nuclease DNA2 isoform X3 [Tripterygium wilfordii]|uniref:DNA helicase n=1 Tax=Tripterygium wilfordii TaxID=458696 RepID=A0A7J7DCZ6_TRIWF|nr:DNA replication ATP-dependent helicase/nuclease DNA2 isoform X3 [Tripterygium wilfordii]